MAIYHLFAGVISRGEGHSVVAAAAYRSAKRLVDARTGEVHDYSKRSGVDHAKIITPPGAPAWCTDREELWNRVEAAERRKDSQLARQIDLALPIGLCPAELRELGYEYVREHFTSRGMVVDVAFHDLQGRNPHIHLMLTLRTLAGDGFGKKNREWNSPERLKDWRRGWATTCNRALERAGSSERIDHRTLDEQRQDAIEAGDTERARQLERAPTRHRGKAATGIAARGEDSTRIADLARLREATNDELARLRTELDRVEDKIRQVAAEQEREERAAREAEQRQREAEKKAAREAEQLQRREAERAAREDKEREAERAAREDKEREAERAAREAEQRQRREAEKAAREAEERRQRQEAEKKAAREAEQLQRREAEKKAREDKEREAERAAREAEQRQRREAEKAAREAEERRQRQEENRRCATRIEALRENPIGWDLYSRKLLELEPDCGKRPTAQPANVKRALDYAENELVRGAARRAAAKRQREEVARRNARYNSIAEVRGGHERLMEAGWSRARTAAKQDQILSTIETQLTDDFDRREQAIRTDTDGESLLQAACHEALGDDRRPATLAERARVLSAAEDKRERAIELRRAQQERKADIEKQGARLDQQFATPGGDELFFSALEKHRPRWRDTGTRRDIGHALDVCEQEVNRASAFGTARHDIVVTAEETFSDTTSTEWRQGGSSFGGGDASDHEAIAILGTLSARARARSIIAEREESHTLRHNIVQRIVKWLHNQIEKLLRVVSPVQAASTSRSPSPATPPEAVQPAYAPAAGPTTIRGPAAVGEDSERAMKRHPEAGIPSQDELMNALEAGEQDIDSMRERFATHDPSTCIGEVVKQAIDPLLLDVILDRHQRERWLAPLEAMYESIREAYPTRFEDVERSWAQQRREWPIPSVNELMNAVVSDQPELECVSRRFTAHDPTERLDDVVEQGIDPKLLDVVLGPEEAPRWCRPLEERYEQMRLRYGQECLAQVEAEWKRQRPHWGIPSQDDLIRRAQGRRAGNQFHPPSVRCTRLGE